MTFSFISCTSRTTHTYSVALIFYSAGMIYVNPRRHASGISRHPVYFSPVGGKSAGGREEATRYCHICSRDSLWWNSPGVCLFIGPGKTYPKRYACECFLYTARCYILNPQLCNNITCIILSTCFNNLQHAIPLIIKQLRYRKLKVSRGTLNEKLHKKEQKHLQSKPNKVPHYWFRFPYHFAFLCVCFQYLDVHASSPPQRQTKARYRQGYLFFIFS